MFGLEHVTQATDWLKAKPGRRIEISTPVVDHFEVEFCEGLACLEAAGGPDLMTALKVGLALVDPKG